MGGGGTRPRLGRVPPCAMPTRRRGGKSSAEFDGMVAADESDDTAADVESWKLLRKMNVDVVV